jgi:hypothetical protein
MLICDLPRPRVLVCHLMRAADLGAGQPVASAAACLGHRFVCARRAGLATGPAPHANSWRCSFMLRISLAPLSRASGLLAAHIASSRRIEDRLCAALQCCAIGARNTQA